MRSTLLSLLRRPRAAAAASRESWSILRGDTMAPTRLIQEQRFEEAEQLLKAQHAINPASRETLTQLAVLCEAQQRWEAALDWWNAIMLEPARRWETGYHRARAMLHLDRTAPARALFVELLPGSVENAGILTICGNLLDEFPAAMRPELRDLLEAAVVRHEGKGHETAQTLQVRYQIARSRERWSEAYDFIRKALLLRPQDAQLRAALTDAAERAGRDPAEALRLDPSWSTSSRPERQA